MKLVRGKSRRKVRKTSKRNLRKARAAKPRTTYASMRKKIAEIQKEELSKSPEQRLRVSQILDMVYEGPKTKSKYNSIWGRIHQVITCVNESTGKERLRTASELDEVIRKSEDQISKT